MSQVHDPQSPSGSAGWEDVEDEDDSDELFSQSLFPVMHNRVLMTEIVGNNLRASDLRIGLEALAKYTNDPAVEFVTQDVLPPGWDDAKEFIGLLPAAVEKFYRFDAFLRVHQEYPEQLFACMYYLAYACCGFTAILAESSHFFGDAHDQELTALLNGTYSILDARAAIHTLACVHELPNLNPLLERTENYLMAQLPGQLNYRESDDELAEATEGVIHLRAAEGGNVWQSYLVQLMVGLDFVENACKVLSAPRLHSLQLHTAILGLLYLVARLMRNVVNCPLSEQRRQAIDRGTGALLTWLTSELATDPEKLFSGGRERSCQSLSLLLGTCNDVMEEMQLNSSQVAFLQRRMVTELLKSSNFTRLLSAVQECGALLHTSLRRTRVFNHHQQQQQQQQAAAGQAGEGGDGMEEAAEPDFVTIEENVQWLNQERIVRQMLRVNLHQSQYAEAVLSILRVLAESGHLNDDHLDMLWGTTEQEDTFDVVKTNVCHMIKQLAAHLRPQQLDLLFAKFESRKGRTLADTLRLLDLLKRLAQSDTKKASSMAEKLVELVWELTTPGDAPPEVLNCPVMLDVLEGYRQHAMLLGYIRRCVQQLAARTNVYTALTVLQNLLRLWGKLYGWEARSMTREEKRTNAPRPLPGLLGYLDHPGVTGTAAAAANSSAAFGPPNPPLSRLLIDNLCDFVAGAARWLEERLAPPPDGAGAAASGGGPLTQPPGQGPYSYQQIVRRYLDVFRLVSQCKDTFVEPQLVELLWDGVVLRPNTPEDMPSGLDLILAFAGEGDDSAQAADADTDGMEVTPGPLLELRDLCDFLILRVTKLPVENLAQPAFLCFKACLRASRKGLEDLLQQIVDGDERHSGAGADIDEHEAMQLMEEVQATGQSYLWQIVLDCQRSDVTSLASEMLIHEMYGSRRIHDLVSDTRTRLMAAAAVLTSAPPGTTEWSDVALPADVMESPGWEVARTRATRCLQLLEQLAGKAEDAMPPVPMHSASWHGPPQMLEVATQEAGRLKLVCAANEYVGLLRRKVAQRIGADPACVRLLAGGQELRKDSRTLAAALPASWSPRQALLAQVSPRANRYTRFGEDWWSAWHGSSTLAHMYHDDQLYRVLLLLADLPKAPGVRSAACHLLQQLPTCSWVPAELLAALTSDTPAERLRGVLLGGGAAGTAGDGAGGRGVVVERPGLLLYTLQALYALLAPSYPPDLLPLVYKPYPPPTPSSETATAAAAAAGTSAAPAPAAAPWWQMVGAGGSAADRLLPVLARCVPLLAEVVDRVMVQVVATAAAATATAGAGATATAAAAAGTGSAAAMDAAGRAAMTQPADLAFVKDFQWVMVFMLCSIHSRARRGPSLDGQPQTHTARAASGGTRAQPADSLSSSHGQEHPDDPAAATAATAAGSAAAGGPRPVGPTHGSSHRPTASGGQDSEVGGTAAVPIHGGGGGAAAAATPEVTSAEVDVGEVASMQLGTQLHEGGAHSSGPGGAGAGGSSGRGPAAAAAALVSGLAVSSRGSPAIGGTAPVAADSTSCMDTGTVVATVGAGATGPPPPARVSQLGTLDVPVVASSTDVEMQPAEGEAEVAHGVHHDTRPQQPLPAPNPAGPVPSLSMAQASAGGGFGGGGATAAHGPARTGTAGGSSDAAVAAAGNALLRQYLGPEGLRCLVSLLVRTAHDAGRLWGYGSLLTAQQQLQYHPPYPLQQAQQPQAGTAASTGCGTSLVPSYSAMASAAEVACRLAAKALQVLSRLVHWPDLRDAFLEDPRTLPMLLETLSCEFSEGIREVALAQLEGVFASPQSPLPPGHLTWVLRQLLALRHAAEQRLDSCLELHMLVAKVVSQLPDLASAGAEARLLADGALSEEVARLDVGAEELLQPRKALLLRGKLVLTRELVRALDRLGLGLGANGRPGLISLLLNRYLFPEALPLWQPEASHPAMEEALHHVAADPAVRQEGLALVQFLMAGCPANLEQGFRDLARLHYENGLRAVDRKFDIGGEGVRSAPDWPSPSSSASTVGPSSFVGLRNGGATCYMNSVLQQLFMQPRIRELILGAAAVDPQDQADSVFHQLQVLFAYLCLGRAACFHPRGFWHSFKDYDGQPIDVREHQDAYEFFTRLQDSVDSYLRATGQPPAMQAVMGGKFAAQIICKDVNYRSEREEEFYQVSVEVKGFSSLEKSLEGYVAGELMEGDNSYYCEELGARVAAVRRTVIKELPQTLVIHLKRFEYDHLNMTRYKLRDRFEFPVVLDMFKYTADGLAALEATGAGLAPGGAAAGGSGAGAAASQAGTDGAAAGTSGGTSAANGSGGMPRARNSYLYELKGIVVHSGTAFAGHYYSFIKERPRVGDDGQVTDGSWHRFDDKVVTPWSIQDLEADCFGGRPPATSASGAGGGGGGSRADAERPYSAYMLFYERRDAASYDKPASERRAVPRDLLLAAQQQQLEEAAARAARRASAPSGGSVAAAGTASGAEAAGATAVRDDMETDGDVPQPSGRARPTRGTVCGDAAAAALAAGPAGGGDERAEAGVPSGRLEGAGQAGLITTPYGMPVLLFQAVLRDNMLLMHKLHVLNKEYFAFVRQVVEVTWEAVLAGRKTRRRELNHNPNPASNHLHPSHSHSQGAAPMSPHPGTPTLTTNTTGNTGNTGGGGGAAAAASVGSGGAATESSSAPSQRNEELDETVLLSARLACAFLLNVYMPAPPALRADLPQWRDLLHHLLSACPRACVELLRMVAGSQAALHFYFVRSPLDGVWLAEVIAVALQAAGRAAIAAAAVGGGSGSAAAADDAPGGGAQQQQHLLPQHLSSAAQQLTAVLSDMAFGVLHDQQRSEPNHQSLCRALAALVLHDTASARALLGAHLVDAFALPGFLLTDIGAANEPEMLDDLSAALSLIHALCQYCYHTNAPMQASTAAALTTAAAAAAAAQPHGGGSAVAQPHHPHSAPPQPFVPIVYSAHMVTMQAAPGVPPRPLLYDLTAQLDELVALHDGCVFDAALAHTSLLHQSHVLELLHFLMAGSSSASIQFLNAVLDRLTEAEVSGSAIVEMLDGLPAALTVYDTLCMLRVSAAVYGGGGDSRVVRTSLARLANQALQRQQGLSWLGMVVGCAIASLYGSSDLVRNVVRSAQPTMLPPLVQSVVVLSRQLGEFAALQAERAGSAGGGGRDAAANATAAALAARARRASHQLSTLVQECLPALHAVQERQRQQQAAVRAVDQARAAADAMPAAAVVTPAAVQPPSTHPPVGPQRTAQAEDQHRPQPLQSNQEEGEQSYDGAAGGREGPLRIVADYGDGDGDGDGDVEVDVEVGEAEDEEGAVEVAGSRRGPQRVYNAAPDEDLGGEEEGEGDSEPDGSGGSSSAGDHAAAGGDAAGDEDLDVDASASSGGVDDLGDGEFSGEGGVGGGAEGPEALEQGEEEDAEEEGDSRIGRGGDAEEER